MLEKSEIKMNVECISVFNYILVHCKLSVTLYGEIKLAGSQVTFANHPLLVVVVVVFLDKVKHGSLIRKV